MPSASALPSRPCRCAAPSSAAGGRTGSPGCVPPRGGRAAGARRRVRQRALAGGPACAGSQGFGTSRSAWRASSSSRRTRTRGSFTRLPTAGSSRRSPHSAATGDSSTGRRACGPCRGLVPDDVLARRTKASFDGAFWNRHSRAFAAGWSGGGVDPDLVDTDALRREWVHERPDGRTFTLLQALWLAERGSAGSDRVEQPLAGVGH